jgi:nucleoside-diphosphate-sugar epimerase
MRVFVTGATGFVGSRVVEELIGAGHQVVGLTRSDGGAELLARAGAEVHRGDLDDLESLRSGTAKSDAVIHTAFRHDWSKFAESCEMDKRAIEVLGAALEGSHRPLLVTGGAATTAQGRPATEEDPAVPPSDHLPRSSEQTGLSFVERGVNASVVRLPQVHDPVKQGLVTYLVAIARDKGVSAYIGEGRNRWAAAHVLDVARLYRLALEKNEAAARYNAVAEEGVPLRDIAEVIGQGLKVPVVSLSPEEAPAHFGFLAMFAGRDLVVSSKLTQERLGWHPAGPGLIADLKKMKY